MSAASRTPGPWHVGGENVGDGLSILDAAGNRVAHTAARRNQNVELIDPAEAKANAHLIAAAPDLLAACKLILQHGRIDDSESRLNIVAAAIAAAETQS